MSVFWHEIIVGDRISDVWPAPGSLLRYYILLTRCLEYQHWVFVHTCQYWTNEKIYHAPIRRYRLSTAAYLFVEFSLFCFTSFSKNKGHASDLFRMPLYSTLPLHDFKGLIYKYSIPQWTGFGTTFHVATVLLDQARKNIQLRQFTVRMGQTDWMQWYNFFCTRRAFSIAAACRVSKGAESSQLFQLFSIGSQRHMIKEPDYKDIDMSFPSSLPMWKEWEDTRILKHACAI